MKRRTFLKGLGAALALGGGAAGIEYWPEDGFTNPCDGVSLPPSLAAAPVVRSALEDVDFALTWDTHTHLTGTGDSGSGIWVNPRMDRLYHPIEFVQKAFYLNAACAGQQGSSVDAAYVERLWQQANGFPPGFKAILFAFDRFYHEDGTAVPDLTQFYVPNRYAARVAADHGGRFEWVASVHPLRTDWKEELEFCMEKGARAVKWLPSAMGIDPASARCDAFYEALAKAGLPLITHAGTEHAASGAGLDDYGNPLRLRRALDHGVRVVVAHCASLGAAVDLDKGANGPREESFQLFSRLMGEQRYAALLAADISAITQVNRMQYVKPILERVDWHSRLLNGSDYPLPGVMPLFSMKQLAAAGVLKERAIPVLLQLRRHNALLFDFVLKRSLEANGKRFPITVFQTKTFFLGGTV